MGDVAVVAGSSTRETTADSGLESAKTYGRLKEIPSDKAMTMTDDGCRMKDRKEPNCRWTMHILLTAAGWP